MIQQLNPPIPVITKSGPGLAHAIIDYGIDHDLYWIVFRDKDGECWTYSNKEIRAQSNLTYGRDYISPFYDPQEVAFQDFIDGHKNCTLPTHFLHLKCEKCKAMDFVPCQEAKDWECKFCKEPESEELPSCADTFPEKKPINDDLWHLGNEVVRLRQSLDKNDIAPGSIMPRECFIKKINQDIKDILELLNKVRMISGNIKIQEN